MDFFKNYNDTYGHLKGDMCLKNVAATIKHLCKRSLDIVTRFGGEEFVVLLSETTIETAPACSHSTSTVIQNTAAFM